MSSTYADLQEERQQVIKMLMQMDCIPAGMELFPALDEEQFRFIKKVIDDCDYYLLIIGGRYGSTTAEGISYTEKEYDYAVERGLKVVALIHKNPDAIAYGKSEQDPVRRERLKLFREKVATDRLVQWWNSAHELPALVAVSLTKTISEFPAVGWVRANRVASEELLAEINDLRKQNSDFRKQNDSLQAELAKFSSRPILEDLAGLEDEIKLYGTFTSSYRQEDRSWEITLKWSQVFALVAPYMASFPTDGTVNETLTTVAFKMAKHSDGYRPYLDNQLFRTIALQLKALNLVEINYTKTVSGSMALFWSLTPYGERLMMQLRTVKKVNGSGNEET